MSIRMCAAGFIVCVQSVSTRVFQFAEKQSRKRKRKNIILWIFRIFRTIVTFNSLPVLCKEESSYQDLLSRLILSFHCVVCNFIKE